MTMTYGALPAQFDVRGLINRFNDAWLDKGVAWISRSSSKTGYTYSVITSLTFWPLRVTLKNVQSAYKDTLKFFDENSEQLRAIYDRDFCPRVLNSFTYEKSGFFIRGFRLSKIIDTIIPSEERVSTGSISLEMALKEYQPSIAASKLPYNDDSRALIDVLFLVGPFEELYPAHKDQLVMRSEYWNENIMGKWKGQTVIKLPDVDAEGFLLYLEYMYAWKFPSELSQFCELIKVLQLVKENMTEGLASSLRGCVEKSKAPVFLDFMSSLVQGNFRGTIGNSLDAWLLPLVMKQNPSMITKEIVHWMVTRENIEIEEMALADFAVNWEKAYLPPGGKIGDILRAHDLEDGTCLGDHLRLCWIPYMELAKKMSVFRHCQSPELFGKNLELSYRFSLDKSIELIDDFAPLPNRCKLAVKKKETYKDTMTISAIIPLSLSEVKAIIPNGSYMPVYKSDRFAIGPLLFNIQIGSNQYNGIFLYRSSNENSVEFDFKTSINGNGKSFVFPLYHWSDSTKSGALWFDKNESDPKLEDFFSDDQYPSVTFDITKIKVVEDPQ